jgi:aminopeptidase-like protein
LELLVNTLALQEKPHFDTLGQDLHAFVAELYPICRSITGNGLRQTLRVLQQQIPLVVREVPSGTRVFDWTVPREWNVRDAYVIDATGKKIIDFQKHNLHLVNYSVPFQGKLSLAELKQHLHTIAEHPDWIPYRTSYYKESWGFCLPHRQWLELKEGDYEVYIDSSLENGSLSYGEFLLPGETTDEVLISCHTCHPSLANDNLSGVAVGAFLAKHLQGTKRRYSYRFLFIPGTIGAIAWLSLNERSIASIRHGLVLAGLGDRGPVTYKRSRVGNAEIDKAAAYVLQYSAGQSQVLDFSPYGYDERQYCSPGINLPVGRLSRSVHGTFPEYHTSADNLDFVSPQSLAESFHVTLEILSLIEKNRTFLNLSPKCEPQLGSRGLYAAIGGAPDAGAKEAAMLWVLNLSDGNHSLLDIAERSKVPFAAIRDAVENLLRHGLLRECRDYSASSYTESLERVTA